jgi:2-oxoglutarate ferredoxin oxidoreductase subunit beta
VPLGVFRAVERPSYDDLLNAQLAEAKGDGDLAALVGSGDTWTID